MSALADNVALSLALLFAMAAGRAGMPSVWNARGWAWFAASIVAGGTGLALAGRFA